MAVVAKPAATADYGASPTLTRAVPSRWPSPLKPHQRLFAWALATAVPVVFYAGPLLLMAPPFLYLVSPRAALGLLVFDGICIAWPAKEWPWFRGVFQCWYELFEFKHNLATKGATPLKLSDKQLNSLTILAMHPHGIIPIHGVGLWPALCDQYLGPLYGFGATTDAAMKLPLLRQLLAWMTAGSADRKVLTKGMETGKNLFILPGGVAEIFVSEPGTHTIIAKRHGLMKLALRTGAVIVPMYVFGGTDFLSHLATHGNKERKQGGKPPNIFGTITAELSRRFKGGITFFWGQWGTPVPFQCKVAMVMGDPIEPIPGTLGNIDGADGGKLTCTKVPDPTDEQVEELMGRYTDALTRLFDQYKAQAGYPDAVLEIK